MARDENLIDRLKRAESWIRAASKLEPQEKPEAFLFLYIAFNCLYGRRQYEGDEVHVEEDLDAFVKKLLRLHEQDVQAGGKRLPRAIEACRKDGAVLIRDRFLVNRYWRMPDPPGILQERLNRDAVRALAAMDAGSYEPVLSLVFRRLAVLRNQVMHGCATYGPASFGRASLEKGLHVLRALVPACYDLVRRYGPELRWDPIPYPRTGPMMPPAVRD